MNTGQWSFPWLLVVVVELAELLRIHAELPCHLDLGVRKAETLASINPTLQLLRECFRPHAASLYLSQPLLFTSIIFT